jgi:hypothetical protein
MGGRSAAHAGAGAQTSTSTNLHRHQTSPRWPHRHGPMVRSEALIEGRASRPQMLSAVTLFEAYLKDKQPKPSKIHRWRFVFTALDTEDWRAPHWDAQQARAAGLGADEGSFADLPFTARVNRALACSNFAT